MAEPMFLSPPTEAGQPSPSDLRAESLARDIASDMPSPYCPGRSIASCPTQAARDLEDDILDLAKQGMDREQIEGVLVDRFGQDKMGSAHQGEVLVAILVVAALALFVIVRATRGWLRSSPRSPHAEGRDSQPGSEARGLEGVSADELDRLEDELDEIDGI